MTGQDADRIGILTAAGFAVEDTAAWQQAMPAGTTTFLSDCYDYSDFWLKAARLLARAAAGGAPQRGRAGGGGRDPRCRAGGADAVPAPSRRSAL